MNRAEISIIVPVYNVAGFLPRCIDSLLGQTFEDLQIILIDDGSTDGSEAICDEYQKKDRRVLTLHQQNRGVSAARNTGLGVASAEYILFVDSDDYLHPEACERLYAMAKDSGCDIVAGNAFCVEGGKVTNSIRWKSEPGAVLSGKDFFIQAIRRRSVHLAVWFALYKKELILSEPILFQEGILSEDLLWTPQIYLMAEKATCIDFEFYYYVQREGSIMRTPDQTKRSRDLLYICIELYGKYHDLDRTSRMYLYDLLCGQYLAAVYMGKRCDVSRTFALKTAYTPKNRLKAAVYFCSPRLYMKLISVMRKMRGLT